MTDSSDPAGSSSVRDSAAWPRTKIALFVGLAVAAGLLYWQFGDYLSFKRAAAAEASLRQFVEDRPAVAVSAAFAVYVAVTALSLPGALFLTLIVGWGFGFWQGLLLVSFASTIGATSAFLISRYLLRDAIRRRFGERLKTFEKNLEKDGPFYLFSLRLIPAVPFFVVNIVMALTPIATRTFYCVSQLGMLPGTAAFVYAGSTIDLQRVAEEGPGGLVSTELLIALAVLGLMPLALRKVVGIFGSGDPAASETPEVSTGEVSTGA